MSASGLGIGTSLIQSKGQRREKDEKVETIRVDREVGQVFGFSLRHLVLPDGANTDRASGSDAVRKHGKGEHGSLVGSLRRSYPGPRSRPELEHPQYSSAQGAN